jgi:hypothetical protein
MLSSREPELFDDNWCTLARSNGVSQLDDAARVYDNTLRILFQNFPVSNKLKKHLKLRLESFNIEDHLGGANELIWWAFMRLFHWSATPIHARQGGCPDFHITSPHEFFCEVTTLNPSDYEKKKFTGPGGLPLDHTRTIERIITKIGDDAKSKQIRYGFSQEKPSVLVLFDCTIWGGFPTQFYGALAEFLLESTSGTTHFPVELSAIVYAQYTILPEGQIGISKLRSAVYHNPNSQYKLPESVFSMMHQYLPQHRELQPPPVESGSDYGLYWFLLSS